MAIGWRAVEPVMHVHRMGAAVRIGEKGRCGPRRIPADPFEQIDL
jgi:hypothetical protein